MKVREFLWRYEGRITWGSAPIFYGVGFYLNTIGAGILSLIPLVTWLVLALILMKLNERLVLKCPSCGRETSLKEKFCSRCGHELRLEKSSICCPAGHKIHSWDDFCPKCGLPVKQREKSDP